MTQQATPASPIGNHDVSTTEGGRAYLAEYFETRLERRDYAQYIGNELAGDFACTLAKHLQAAQKAPAPEPTIDSVSRNAIELRALLDAAPVVERQEPVAWFRSDALGCVMWKPCASLALKEGDPLYTRSDAGEVERLRIDLELTRLARQGEQIEIDGLKALCDGFRAQLGERDAQAIERAAKWVDRRLAEYVRDHGMQDLDTGTLEFPGDGAEYAEELDFIASSIRSLSASAEPTNKDADQ